MKSFKKLFVICLTILAAATFSGVMLSCSDSSSDSSPVVFYYPAGITPGAAADPGSFAGLQNIYSVYSIQNGTDPAIVLSNMGVYMVLWFDDTTSSLWGMVKAPGATDWIYCTPTTATSEQVPTVYPNVTYDSTNEVLNINIGVPVELGAWVINSEGTDESITGDDVTYTQTFGSDGPATVSMVYKLDVITPELFTQSGIYAEDCVTITALLAANTK